MISFLLYSIVSILSIVSSVEIWIRYRRERALESLPASRVQIPQVEAMHPCDVTKAVAKKWRLLDEKEKTKYRKKAKAENDAALAAATEVRALVAGPRS